MDDSSFKPRRHLPSLAPSGSYDLLRPLPQGQVPSSGSAIDFAHFPGPKLSPAHFNRPEIKRISSPPDEYNDPPYVPKTTRSVMSYNYSRLPSSAPSERDQHDDYDKIHEDGNSHPIDHHIATSQSRRAAPFQPNDGTQNCNYYASGQVGVVERPRIMGTMSGRCLANQGIRRGSTSFGYQRPTPYPRGLDQGRYSAFNEHEHGRRKCLEIARVSSPRAQRGHTLVGRSGDRDRSSAADDGNASSSGASSDDDTTLGTATNRRRQRQKVVRAQESTAPPMVHFSGDPGDWLRHRLNLPPQAPVNLQSVQDPPVPDGKPGPPLQLLVQVAIYGSPDKKLTLQEIYCAIKDRFPYYRNRQDKAWQQTIRHSLSLYSVFRHSPRPLPGQGKGKYWELDYSQGQGTKRVRKRRQGGRPLTRDIRTDDEEHPRLDDDTPNRSSPDQLDESTQDESHQVFVQEDTSQVDQNSQTAARQSRPRLWNPPSPDHRDVSRQKELHHELHTRRFDKTVQKAPHPSICRSHSPPSAVQENESLRDESRRKFVHDDTRRFNQIAPIARRLSIHCSWSPPSSTRSNVHVESNSRHPRSAQLHLDSRSVSPNSPGSESPVGDGQYDHDISARQLQFADHVGFRPVAFGQASLAAGDSASIAAAFASSGPLTSVPRSFDASSPAFAEDYSLSPPSASLDSRMTRQPSDDRAGVAVPSKNTRARSFGHT